MDGAMGKEEEVVEAVLTCEGDFHDPELLNHLEKFRLKLTVLLLADEARLNLKKVEPWNSVKVTFTIPREAALKLRQLAQSGNEVLRQMGVLSVQLQGDSSISLKIVGRNNEPTELMLQTSGTASSVASERGVTVNTANEVSSPGPSNEEVTRKNIVDYLIQGPPNLRPNAIFNSILGANAPTAAPFLGANRGVPTAPDSFSGVGGSRPILRPNSMANIGQLPNSALRGSHPNNFPFAKTSGAFHIPIPHQSSVGQSSSDFQNFHSNSLPINTTGLVNSSGFQHSGSQQKNNSGTSNMFGPIGAKLPGSSTVSNTLPPSSSPGFMIDLPPPPPYPHSSNSLSKPGKQVSATSPLLVNLLQTDPITVAAGMASTNTSKTVTVGNTSPAPPPKKKKRSKKAKEAVSNSFSNMEDILNKDVLGNNPMFNPSFSSEPARIPDPSVSFSSKMQKEYFPGSAQIVHSFSNRPEIDSKAVSDKSFKPLITSDRPFGENSSNSSTFSLSKFNSTVSSAIVTDHVRSGETNGPRELSQELIDSFSKEIAAGKIINPYTGQLEARENLPEINSGKFKEDLISSRVFANKAREVGNSNYNDVPVSVSRMMDINVLRSLSSVSSSTAALFHSGSTLHLNSEKHPSQFPSHVRNFSDDSVSTNKNVYAAKLNSKLDNESLITSISSTFTQSTFNPHQVSPSPIQNQVKNSNQTQVTGPSGSLTKVQGRPVLNQHVQSVTPTHTVPSSLLSSGVSESVINSKSGSSCLSTTFPVTHKDSFVKHLEHNPSLFQLTSCANSNTQSSSVPHHSQSSKMFSSCSQNVQTRPVLSQAQSSLQTSGRLVSSDVSKSIPSQHVQAASSDPISSVTKTNFPHLLNALPEKSLDQQGIIQSPLEKISLEGDDNSNHSGLVSENIPENSGTSVLLEHTGVKAENHDSGVGSSSERSDDTPSEPGDGEFRANNSSESEEMHKSNKRLVGYKADVGNDVTTNTITVGYMMSSIDNSSNLKSSLTRDNHEDIKTTTVSLTTNSKLDSSFETQVNSLHPQTDLQSSTEWTGKGIQTQSSTYSDKKGLNGPLIAENEDGLKSAKKEFQHDSKLNGPSSKEMDEMLLTIAGLQDKNEQISSKRSPVFKRHGVHLQQEVLEEMVKLQHLAASKDLIHSQGKLDKEDSSESLHRGMGSNEDRHDQLPYFDMEELVNGKLFGNGTSNVDNKTGSNITSIYSKRSSPVNVNMLNHIYAPGLPLPRRLTESVQRLVKPLPASESSMPQKRLCKSPGVGSPRAGSNLNGPSPSRMALISGTRSPGSSIPKLIPNDKHSLLSGGLDLAGLSSKFPPNSVPLSELASENTSSDASSQMLGLATDFLSRDGQSHGFLSSCHVSPPLLTDSLAHTQKMLSQSYPPHKSRDLSNSVSIHDLFSRIQQPHQSLAESLQESSTLPLKSSEATNLSHNSHTVQRSHHNMLNSVPQSDSFSLPSHSSHTRVTPTETSAESAHPKNSKTTHSSLSSPNHSRSASPTTLSISNRLESSLSKTSSLAFKTASDTSGVSSHWAKISLNNGSKNSSNQKISVSSQKNVPYVTLSSNSVASSAVHSVSSVSPRITPAVCSALLSGSVIGNPSSTSKDHQSVLKSTKPDPCSSPRAISKSDFTLARSTPITSAISRNLFESVSCDLATIPNSVVQTSRNKTLDNLVSHSSSKSVLDLNHAQDLNIQSSKVQRKKSDSSQGHISPQLNFHSDINSLQSIRTNETPSTSLPAQVVHLDFPHLPPTVSETAVNKSVADHMLPVSQNLVKSPVSSSKTINHNWNSHLPNPTSVASFPVSPVSKITSPLTTVALDRKDKVTNIQSTPSPPLKEPILETLASALGSLKKINENQSLEVESASLTSSSAVEAILKSDVNDLVNEIMPDDSNQVKKDNNMPSSFSDQSSSSNSGCTPKRMLKRSVHLMEGGQKDDIGDGCSGVKCFVMESANKVESDLLTHTKSNKVDGSETESGSNKTEVSSSSVPVETVEQKMEVQLSLSVSRSPIEDHSESVKEPYTSSSIQGIQSELETSINVPDCNMTMSERDNNSKDISIPISLNSVSLDNIKNNCQTDTEQETTLPTESHSEHKSSLESDIIEMENSNAHVSTLNKQISFQEVSSNEKDTASTEKDQLVTHEKLDSAKNIIEMKTNRLIEDTHGHHKAKKDDSIQNADSTVCTSNAEPKLDDGNRKGHRIKRQFYAYVPEKSIDQTYFDTPILSGRTRSRNKPSELASNYENTVHQEGSNDATGLSDSQTSAVTAGVKTELSDLGNKRSTRSLRTKETPQDLTANKRRRLQTRDHR